MDAGVWVVVVAVVAALALGGYRTLTDGRARAVRGASPGVGERLGVALGERATFVQFSSSLCAPCRVAHRLLAEVAASDGSLAHVELDAEAHLDLVEEFGITRTPTVLVLDRTGGVRHRFVGVPRREALADALAQVAHDDHRGKTVPGPGLLAGWHAGGLPSGRVELDPPLV